MADKNIHFITGNDEMQVSVAAKALFQELAGDNPDPFASDILVVKEGGDPAAVIGQLISSIMTPPFLGGSKVIWLKHFPAFDDEGTAKSESVVGKALHTLADRLKAGMPDGTILIMDGIGCDKKKSFWKSCQTFADIQEFSKPDMKSRDWRETMRTCICNAAQQRGLNLEYNVIDALTDMLGCNSDFVESELDKLICYCEGGQRPITAQDVAEICTPCCEEQGWALNDCLGKRNLPSAIAAMEKITMMDKDPDGRARGLLFSAAGIFNDLMNVIVFMADKKLRSPNELKNFLERLSDEQKKEFRASGNTIGTMHPYRAMMLAEQARRYSPHEMIQAIITIRDAMWQTTTSDIRPVIALENALIKII